MIKYSKLPILMIGSLMFIQHSLQHGRMHEPPSRNAMWRAGFDVKPNYDDSELFCGGIMAQWKKNDGRCGVCGDSFSDKQPRPHETGGEFASGISVRSYSPGSEIVVIIEIVANHMGSFKFGLCPRKSASELETEECFLPLKVNGTDLFTIKTHRTGMYSIPVTLPPKLTCDYCVFRWHWKSANNWGTCSDGTEAVGCGPQETYRNCADITVGNNHGVRGHNFMQFQVIPNLNLERIVSNEIPKDNFITYHPVQWPKDYNSQEKLSSKNSTIESLRGNNATNHHNESNDEKNI
ncbi:Proton-coupled folate transporter [Sarcoptes scabiei]|nr:Proton-coupled folate transporter [Sarcoptes scabiei]